MPVAAAVATMIAVDDEGGMLRWPRNRLEAWRFVRRLLALLVLAMVCGLGFWLYLHLVPMA